MTTPSGDDTPTAADLAAEALLGALLWDPRRVRDVAAWLEADDFYRPAHGAIYATVLGMLGEGRPVDVFTVLESLWRGEFHDGHIDRTRGPLSGPGLHSLISMTPATPRADDRDGQVGGEHVRYARIVQEDAIRRQVHALGIRIGQYARHVSDRDSDEAADLVTPVLAETQARLRELTDRLSAARSSIAAALNPTPRRTPVPAPPRPSEQRSRPAAVDAEQLRRAEYRLVGACLVSPGMRRLVEGQLRGSDFTAREIAATWEAITALQHRGDPVDFVLVAHQVELQGALPGVGHGLRPDQLHKLAARTQPIDGVGALETVVRAALTRNLHRVSDRLQNLAADRARSGADVVRDAEHLIADATTTTRRLTATGPQAVDQRIARRPSQATAATTAAAVLTPPATARPGSAVRRPIDTPATAAHTVRATPEAQIPTARQPQQPGAAAPPRTAGRPSPTPGPRHR